LHLQDIQDMNVANYTRTAISLHWLIALLILVAVPLGMVMTDLDLSPTKLKMYSWHKWIGVTVFALALLRIVWRVSHAAPPLPVSMPRWQHKATAALHGMLYLLMLAVPVTGWLMSSAKGFQTVWFGVLPLPDLVAKDKALGEFFEETHEALVWFMLLLVAGHVAATVKHHLIDHDEIAGRMLPWLANNRSKA
jgi:cytochrome b561